MYGGEMVVTQWFVAVLTTKVWFQFQATLRIAVDKVELRKTSTSGSISALLLHTLLLLSEGQVAKAWEFSK